jgi:C4-dicarboxylate-specific signal transduction histidine kinase
VPYSRRPLRYRRHRSAPSGCAFRDQARRHAHGRGDPGLRALARKSGPQLKRLDIDDVISEVLAFARGELLRHNVVLRTELAADGRTVMGDRLQLQQVLLNLIMNGVEAMREVMERKRELTVSWTLAEPGSVLVAVQDTGSGWIRPSRNAFSSLSSRRNQTASAWG